MTVIERLECPTNCAAMSVVERGVRRCGKCGQELALVEYVPASQLAGAVNALMNLYADFCSGGQREATERVRMELAALGIDTEPYGGQSAAALALPRTEAPNTTKET